MIDDAMMIAMRCRFLMIGTIYRGLEIEEEKDIDRLGDGNHPVRIARLGI